MVTRKVNGITQGWCLLYTLTNHLIELTDITKYFKIRSEILSNKLFIQCIKQNKIHSKERAERRYNFGRKFNSISKHSPYR